MRTKIFRGVVDQDFYIYRWTLVAQILGYYMFIRRYLIKDSGHSQNRWRRSVNLVFLGFGINYLLQIMLYFQFDHRKYFILYYAIYMISMSVFILLFVSKILLVPELFKSRSKYNRSTMRKDQRELYSKMITSVMETDRIFLNKNLRLVDLAHKTNATEHQLSQVLSEHFGMNFPEFINSYRIDMAKQLVIDPNFNHYTIDAIAQEVGFKSKSSFYQSFKKFVGTTPSSYKKQHLDGLSPS
ncbi:MAG: helix-turn-helix domain-containing protein [Bacteroidota bacterium]